MFWWDSVGRFRFVPAEQASPTVGYRYLTINFDTDSPLLPDTLDEVSVAGGTRLGQVAGGEVGVVAGAGYSGDNLFADANGVFGIGHVTWRRPLDGRSSLALTLDYNGNRALLPDVPLPGFAYERRVSERLAYVVGFPRSSLEARLAPRVTVAAAYEAPLTADAGVHWQIGPKLALTADYASFLNGFNLDGEPRTERLFYRMQRAEVGVRYAEPDFVFKGLSLDVAVVAGYAFDQRFGRSFDVRGLEATFGLEDVPYAGVVLRGQF